jgi:apolipoprotein N-acyltransferase
VRLAAVLGSAVLYGLAFPPAGHAPLAWVALVPLVLALRGARARQAAGLAFAWGFVATAGVTVWLVPTLHGHFGLSQAGSVAFWLALAATAAAPYLALAAAGFALAARRAPAALVPALFAAAWVAAEYARAHLGLASPWASLAYTQAESPIVRQLAALGGHYAVGAVVALANATAAEALRAAWPGGGARAWRGALAAVVILIGVGAGGWAYGERRVAAAAGGGAPALEVALVQGAVEPALHWRSAAAGRVVRHHLSLTAELLAGATPDLVVWPESAVQVSLDDAAHGPSLRAAGAGRVPVLLGAPRRAGERSFNSALLVREDGRTEHYDKRRLLPFSETRPLGALGALATDGDLAPDAFTAGTAPGLFAVGATQIGVLICMEALYPALAREAVAAGAQVLAILSNDAWYRGHGGAAQHFAPAVFRAVETGVPVLRAATTGITAVIAPDGQTVARLPEGEAAVLHGPTPPAHPSPPPYLHLGDTFAHICVGIWALATLNGLRSLHYRSPLASHGPRAGKSPNFST